MLELKQFLQMDMYEISVLGTPFTIESGEHLKKIKKKNKKMKINTVACEELCPIEEGWEKFGKRYEVLGEYMSIFLKVQRLFF